MVEAHEKKGGRVVNKWWLQRKFDTKMKPGVNPINMIDILQAKEINW